MSSADDTFTEARRTYWKRHITQTAMNLVPRTTGVAQAAFSPVLEQLVIVYNLASGLVAGLRLSADSPLARRATPDDPTPVTSKRIYLCSTTSTSGPLPTTGT
ncbi:hypothetical protein P9869_38730 [Streptomyces ossamyceticus]|nr:hypothetical protein [Streptomyces ossamyceticus]